MDITLPAENGGRVSYKLVGDPVEPRIGAAFPRIAYARRMSSPILSP